MAAYRLASSSIIIMRADTAYGGEENNLFGGFAGLVRVVE
jgi:hypothetical protein